jgi:hypothetical protein
MQRPAVSNDREGNPGTGKTMDPTSENTTDTARYARCIEVSRRIRWDIDRDVIRGRDFEFSEKFLPDAISGLDRLEFLNPAEKVLLSQIQGRTYVGMFALVERFICAKIIDVSRDHVFGDQVALESLIRFSDEELKHQQLFHRLETMIDRHMPAGYRFVAEPNELAASVLAKHSWAVLAMICQIELFTQAHYRESIAPDGNVSALFKDVFLYHWREESQHAVMDELEWMRENRRLGEEERDNAIDDLIEIVFRFDAVLQAQANRDAGYFLDTCARDFSTGNIEQLGKRLLSAYRWQYLFSGVDHPRFRTLLSGMINPRQMQRIDSSLDTIRHRSVS